MASDPPGAAERAALIHALGERVKELRALRRAASILIDDDPPQEVLERIAGILPAAVQYPDAAAACVTYAGRQGITRGFVQSPWSLSSHFVTGDGQRGEVRIVYLEERWAAGSAPFLEEEGDLLDSLADMLRSHFERRRAEEALRASEALLQTAGRIARLGAWRVDIPAGTLTWSREVCAIHDLPPGSTPTIPQAVGFYDSEHRDLMRAAVDECLRAGVPFDLEARISTARGRRVWVRVIGEVMRNADGATIGIHGALQDITGRKENEARARRLAEQLERTLESITDAFFTLDRNWRFTYLNSEAERQLGRARETLIGRDIRFEFPEAVGTSFEIQGRKAIEQQETVEFEEFFPPRRAWLSVRAYPSEQGLAVYFQNITRQRQAREEARTSEERFRLLARATNDAIWDWDITTNVLWWNEGFETLFGYRRDIDGLTTRSWTARVHPDERPTVIASLERALTEEADTWTAEYRFRRSDGTYAVVLDRGYIIRDAEGTPVRMIGGMTDVSERRRLEAQFLRTQRLESIGTLAGGIAHDLNNVLTPIVMSVSMLKEDETDPGRLEMLNSIEASAQRGAAMVRQVLTFARGVAGRAAPVDPRGLVHDVQKIIRDTFPKDIELTVASEPDAWTVQADATQLHQVVMNLCLNARDAMPEGGSLLLSIRNVTLEGTGSLVEAGREPGPYVLLTVEDNGTGMPREVQDRAFEPFFTTKEVGKGTGLGLSTALTIVKSHGGFIDVQSEPGKGTRVNVYIPVMKEATIQELGSDESRRGATGDGELVLIVDDEDQIRTTTRRMLERFGYRVILAANGAEGVALFLQHQADVAAVITDMAMPTMDGAEMIVALKQIDPDVKIIASSGHAMNEAVEKALDAGVNHFIPKPYSSEAILSALQELLGKDVG